GTDIGGDGGEARPSSDRAATLLFGKTSTDQTQAPRNKQRPADSLAASGYDQYLDIGAQAAPDRGCREEHYPADEDFAAAKDVSQGAADEKQRREKERVRFYDPLNLG